MRWMEEIDFQDLQFRNSRGYMTQSLTISIYDIDLSTKLVASSFVVLHPHSQFDELVSNSSQLANVCHKDSCIFSTAYPIIFTSQGSLNTSSIIGSLEKFRLSIRKTSKNERIIPTILNHFLKAIFLKGEQGK